MTRSQLDALIAANLSDSTLIVPSKHREVDLAIADYIDQQTGTVNLLAQSIVVATAKISTTTNTDDTLQDDWFAAKDIQEIVTGGQTYLRTADFIQQNGDEIKLINGTWNDGQYLRAKI